MRVDRTIRALGIVIVALVVALVAWGVVGVVVGALPGVERVPDQSIGWPLWMPAWPLPALFFAALLVVVVQAPLILVSRSRHRHAAEARGTAAARWLDGATTGTGASSGLTLLAVTGLRAHARGPREIELTWNPPLEEVHTVVVLRSATAFATSPDARDGQTTAYSGDESSFMDTGLADDCVYQYTAFGRSRDGAWSMPAWAWTTTPSSPLHKKMLDSLRMSRTWLYPWPE